MCHATRAKLPTEIGKRREIARGSAIVQGRDSLLLATCNCCPLVACNLQRADRLLSFKT